MMLVLMFSWPAGAFQYLRPDWIEAWIEYGRRFPDDMSPTIGFPKQDDADVGYVI